MLIVALVLWLYPDMVNVVAAGKGAEGVMPKLGGEKTKQHKSCVAWGFTRDRSRQ